MNESMLKPLQLMTGVRELSNTFTLECRGRVLHTLIGR